MPNNNSPVNFVYIGENQALPANRDANTIYFEDSTGNIYVGNKQFATQPSGIVPIEHGGTGNSEGYVRVGAGIGEVGLKATAEGHNNTATGNYSHAEGYGTTAAASYAHAEGENAEASGAGSHAEGSGTDAQGEYSHAEGIGSCTIGESSHAEGYHTQAKGNNSHTEGLYTEARFRSQHVFGEYNALDQAGVESSERGTYIEIVGNGSEVYSPSTGQTTKRLHNARTLDWEGNEWLGGKLTIAVDPTDPMDVTTKQYVDTIRPTIYNDDADTAELDDILNRLFESADEANKPITSMINQEDIVDINIADFISEYFNDESNVMAITLGTETVRVASHNIKNNGAYKSIYCETEKNYTPTGTNITYYYQVGYTFIEDGNNHYLKVSIVPYLNVTL